MTDNSVLDAQNGKNSSDLPLLMGGHYAFVLQGLAAKPGAPESIRADWKILEDWLGCAGRALTHEDKEKVGRAYRAYVALGVAPSIMLQPNFDEMSTDLKREGRSYIADKPPSKVMDVFDRLMASDNEIKEKRTAGWKAERPELEKQFAKAPGKPSPSHDQNWWRRLGRETRAWIYISCSWAILSWCYLMLFDPLKNGWRWDNEDYWKATLILVAPAILGLLKKGYDRFVK